MAESRDNKTDDDDLSIPRAALNKMIKELVPNIRVANESRELILNCCTEFIHLVSSEANEICNKQQKKTISPDHVLLGLFSSHVYTISDAVGLFNSWHLSETAGLG